METIKGTATRYYNKIDPLDLELIISRVLKKPQEFILSHPEFKILATDNLQLTTLIKRRIKHEPLAYILGEKEFYGLKFKVNKNVLMPRPETETLVELALNELATNDSQLTTILDVGTGSGNIIISIVKYLLNHKQLTTRYNFYGIDISRKALAIAKQNAKLHRVDKKIKFIQGGFLLPIIKNKAGCKNCDSKSYSLFNRRDIQEQKIIILANLPYLSPKIYSSTPKSVKNYEPKKALLSYECGLSHYEKLLKQIKNVNCQMSNVKCFLEHSPEQKPALQKLIKKFFPEAEINFHKDLAGKWRICETKIRSTKSEIRNKFK